ncbi:MAG: VWA domain-containing protein [Candidatus Sulfotelmatobacter sp.]|jgi:Ca-activated chloride channel homolog
MSSIFTRFLVSKKSIAAWAVFFLMVAAGRQAGMAQAAPQPSQTPTVQPETSVSAAHGTPAAGTPASEASGSGSSDEDANIPKIRVGTNEVNVVFTVTDKHGKRVTDLKQNDFMFVDDNRPATEIRSFHAETNLPLQVGLLIDASSSVRDRFKFEQESAIEFLNQTVRKRYDLAFVVGFDATPEVTQDFTDDTEKLAHGVRELRPGGGTALYDALYYACRDKLMKEARNGPTRRAIILLSDGDDNQSHVTREEAIEMAQRADAIIYTISTNVSGTKGAGDKVLERMADATGGRAFFPFQIRDVTNAFGEIQDELRSQYAVSYKPADFKADGHFRTIEIVANDRKNYRVRARRGYYAPIAQ